MTHVGGVKILFIAGFGPIVADLPASTRLYKEALGIAFQEEAAGYLHTESLQGARSFALWPLSQAAQSCFGRDSPFIDEHSMTVSAVWDKAALTAS